MHDRSWSQGPPMLVRNYVEQKGSPTMLAAKRSAGVAPDINLRVPLQTGDGTSKGIHLGFKAQGRCHQKSKTGASVFPQKGLMSSKT